MNADQRKQMSQPHSFNELALSYVASHAANMSDAQRYRRLEHLGSYLLTFFGALPLSDISPSKLQKFTYHLEELGLKDKEIQACLVSFRMPLNFGSRIRRTRIAGSVSLETWFSTVAVLRWQLSAVPGMLPTTKRAKRKSGNFGRRSIVSKKCNP